MVEFTKEEQLIARSLLAGPKSVEELRKELNLGASQVSDALKKLIVMKLAERNEDEKYKLIGIIEKQLKGHSGGEVKENFRVRLIIEAVSESKDAIEKQMGMLENSMKVDRIKILKLEKAEVEEQTIEGKKTYCSFIELECWAEEFKDVIYLIINYGPSSIELLEPQKVVLDSMQVQESLDEVVSSVHYYISMIMTLKYKQIADQLQKQPKAP